MNGNFNTVNSFHSLAPLKIRPAWSGKKGRGGAIVSLPADIRKESGLNVGDNVDMKVVNGKIIISKNIKEMINGYEVLPE